MYVCMCVRGVCVCVCVCEGGCVCKAIMFHRMWLGGGFPLSALL